MNMEPDREMVPLTGKWSLKQENGPFNGKMVLESSRTALSGSI